MNKEINGLLKEVKELKIYYVQAKENNNIELQEHFKELIEEKTKRIRYLKEKNEKMEEIKIKKKRLKKEAEEDEQVKSQSNKIKELEQKMNEEKKRKLIEEKKLKREREIKRREEERERERKKAKFLEEERLRKKANLKEVKFGTVTITILLAILFILMLLRGMFPLKTIENVEVEAFSATYFVLSRAYTIVLMIAILIFTYIQLDIKKITFIRIYSTISLFIAFLSFGGIVYIFPKYDKFNFGSYFIVPGLLVLSLVFIFFKLIYRNKLEYQYVRKYEDDEDDDDYDEYSDE